MITPETLLEQCITNYTASYSMNYSTNNPDMPKTILIDSIAWTNKQLKDKDLITEENYKTILAMIHSKNDENIVLEKKCTEEEGANIIKMLESPDEENKILAISIMASLKPKQFRNVE